MAEQAKKLMLIDGNSITYRAFFALPQLTSADGRYTNAVFGFTQMLLKMLADERPTHVAVAFDAGKSTFRHGIYDAYKGTRQRTPGELSEQFPLVRDVLEAFGIVSVELTNYEADDIIGTISREADALGFDTVLVTGDKDLLQLVSPRVHAMLTKKGITEVERYGPEEVLERYGLTPSQITDLKGLMGDSSDNIPGVPGVGEKTALKLLHTYSSVESVLDNVHQISGAKLQERLREHAAAARMSKELATIYRDVPLQLAIDDLAFGLYDPNRVRAVFQRFGFKSLLDRIPQGSAADSSVGGTEPGALAMSNDETIVWDTVEVMTIREQSDLPELWSLLNGAVGVLPDLDSPDYQTANLRGVALGTSKYAAYVSFENDISILDLEPLWGPEYEKVVFDVKALVVSLDAHGYTAKLHDGWFDLMLASYLLNPSEGELKIVDVVERELHVALPPSFQAKQLDPFALAKLSSKMPDLMTHIRSALTAQEIDDLYDNVELPLAFVLAEMEIVGFYVDGDKLRSFGAELSDQLVALTSEIYELAGVEFNINSPKQLGEVLFEKLNLPAQKKTKTGYSTSADVLEKLAPYHEVVEKILEYRMLGKLNSTYVEGLLKETRQETGRVHTSFHQALTATGRLSSKDPNLQNIPVRMEEGRRLRQVFVPTYEDWVILSADYSQIELRILAHLSGDEALIEAFRNGMDIHTRTAADVFEVAPEEVTPLMRRQAKAVNFGIVYGISDYGLAQNLRIGRAQAARFIEDYFAKFPGVARYMSDIVKTAREVGYVTTLLNRRRYLKDIHSSNYNLRSFAERTAMNTPIQGSAADIIKLAMVRIDEALRETDWKSRMLLQVHDELIFEGPESEVERLHELVVENMENALTLSVPLRVDVHSGKSWYEAK